VLLKVVTVNPKIDNKTENREICSYSCVQGSFSHNSLNPTKSWGQKHK